jgi:hypothetical protein
MSVVACSSPTPVAPSQTAATTAAPRDVPPPPGWTPPVDTPTRTFSYSGPAGHEVSAWTRQSSLVLGSDGRFALAYSDTGSQYRGWFSQSGHLVTFLWEGSSGAGPWGAEGVLGDGTLTIRYNLVMQMTDFEDAVYSLVSSLP